MATTLEELEPSQAEKATVEFDTLKCEMALLRQEMSALRSESHESRQEMHALRSELKRLVDATGGSSGQRNGDVLTLAEQQCVMAFSHAALTRPQVEAVGYRRAHEGKLEICAVLSTRELDAHEKVVQLEFEVLKRFPEIRVEFDVLFTPPGSIQELSNQGYEILTRLEETTDDR